jgi:hypothetical protein
MKQGFVEGPLHSHLPEARFWITSGWPTTDPQSLPSECNVQHML